MVYAAFQGRYSDPDQRSLPCPAEGLDPAKWGYPAIGAAAVHATEERPSHAQHGRLLSSISFKAMIKSALRNPLHYGKLQELPYPSTFEVNSAQELHWFEDQTDCMDFTVPAKMAHSLEKKSSPPSRPSKRRSMLKSALSKPRSSISKLASGMKKAKKQISAASTKFRGVPQTLKASLSQSVSGQACGQEGFNVWMVANPIFGFDDQDLGSETQSKAVPQQIGAKSNSGDGFDALAGRFKPETPCTEGWHWSAAELGFGETQLNSACLCEQSKGQGREDGFDALARRFQLNFSCPGAFRFPRVSFWEVGEMDGLDLTDAAGVLNINSCGDGQGARHWRGDPLWAAGGASVQATWG